MSELSDNSRKSSKVKEEVLEISLDVIKEYSKYK
jgi:hypothetical protein